MKLIGFLIILCSVQAAVSARDVAPAFATPITFYGKVVDESGNPVAGASVKFGVHGEKSTYRYQTADLAGYFELSGVTGLGVSVWVSRDGYYTPQHAPNYVYGGVRGKDTPTNPTKESPAVFVLKKMGSTEPLVHVPRKSIRVPKDGTPIDVDLTAGKIVPFGSGHIRFEVWTANAGLDPNLSQPYEWRARVGVPGGGLVERGGRYDFESPQNGFVERFEVKMEKTSGFWRKGFEREFFLKLRSGQFARIHLELTTGGDHFFVLESYLNPTPGARNLEFDPKKVVPTAR